LLINEEAEDIVTDRQEVKGSAKRSALARLINKVYGIDPLICKKCGSKMLIVAFIMDPDQIDKIMQHLKKQGWSQAIACCSPMQPGCSQKRTLLFGEYLTDEVLLKLPNKFFTLTLPKALRIFLKNDKYLFSEISKLIYSMIEDFYTEAAGQMIISGSCLVYQSFGDMMRFNSHWLVASYRLLLAQAAGAWDSIRGRI